MVYDYFVGYQILGIGLAEYFYDNILMTCTVIILFAVVSKINVENQAVRNAISTISSMTTGVFIIHIFLYRVIRIFYDFQIWWVNILLCVVVFIASLIGTGIIKKIPLVKYIVQL